MEKENVLNKSMRDYSKQIDILQIILNLYGSITCANIFSTNFNKSIWSK